MAAEVSVQSIAAQQAPVGNTPANVQPASTTKKALKQHLQSKAGIAALCAGAGGVVALGTILLVKLLRSKKQNKNKASKQSAPCANVKPTATCVPLADGSACVVRRKIPADNSCLFNAIAYAMHGSKQKAAFLRNVVAREVSSDPETYSAAFLGMPNAAYCQWIMNPVNWGGGIELAILARHYGREIGAWCIETGKQHVFGEDSGYPKCVMVIYTGSHYDALAIAKHPKAPESEDKTEFNPRTKSGKMALAAAQKLVLLSGKKGGKAALNKQSLTNGSKQPKLPPKQAPKANGTASSVSLKCEECGEMCEGQAGAAQHASSTGHTRFAQTA